MSVFKGLDDRLLFVAFSECVRMAAKRENIGCVMKMRIQVTRL